MLLSNNQRSQLEFLIDNKTNADVRCLTVFLLSLTLGLNVDFQEQKATDGVEQWVLRIEELIFSFCDILNLKDFGPLELQQ